MRAATTIINIHILTSLTYNSADLQVFYLQLANIMYVVQSCACGVGGPSSGSGGDGEGGEECATGAQ